MNKPQRIAANELDFAVEEALQRIASANELTEAECKQITGGLDAATPGMISPDLPWDL